MYLTRCSDQKSETLDEFYAELRDGLRTGSIAPAVIEMDQSMERMPREIVDLLKQGWEPTGIDALWRRKQNLGGR